MWLGRPFALCLKMANVTITARYLRLERDMRQVSPPGHGRPWRGKRPDKEKKAARRDQRLRNSSNGPMPIHPTVVSGMRTSMMLKIVYGASFHCGT